MGVSAELRARFERFAETGEKLAFKLTGGRDCLGWVGEVGETAILFSPAPGPFALDPPDECIPLVDVVLATLSYRDEEQRMWIDFLTGQPAT